ncbi:universal stress protein [Demetria terragena]|uniref:universal stress protein n=1 Tax=Demetria terragena TaxID=63959 RepID=UPI00037F1894|nr:universal stress protein [Demetria terragena]
MADIAGSGAESGGQVDPEGSAPEGAIVAAIDGQDHDAHVVAWAADEAVRQGRPLHIQEVIDLGISLMAGEGYLPMSALPADSVDGEHSALRAATEIAAARAPDVPVTIASTPGSVTGVLVALSGHAHTMVLGGGGAPGAPFIGSTALSVAAHAKCPTVVIPDVAPSPTGTVVVGVDGSAASRAAAAYAVAFAEKTHSTVRCLISWSVEVVDGAVVTQPDTPEWRVVEERHRAVVEDTLAQVRTRHPAVEIDTVIYRGAASSLLVHEAREAQLLVIGSRGRGGFLGMLLGSTTKRVLKEATCPVAVVRI